ncbi:MAG TPA: peptidylprolyl isomerase [Polyangia bacterium]|nr:peptidylprolyl isomerase [Polyangia bacterium]
MQIQKHSVVSIEYTLKDDAGEVLDKSEGHGPLVYLHGVGNLVPGLEKALEGKAAGDSLEVTLPPEEGYGQRDEKLLRKIPARKIQDPRPQPGKRYRAQIEDGLRIVLVTAVSGDYVSVDANHPLAGMTLHFSVKIVAVREATAEELSHGHVHGQGGHHH